MESTFPNTARDVKKDVQDIAQKAIERTRPSQDKLAQDFKTMINDAEELLRSVAGASGEGVAMARERFGEKLDAAKRACVDADGAVRARVDSAAQSANTYVSDNPWRAVAVAASVGAIVGYLMRR